MTSVFFKTVTFHYCYLFLSLLSFRDFFHFFLAGEGLGRKGRGGEGEGVVTFGTLLAHTGFPVN